MVYYYFGSKEGLYRSLLDEVYEDMKSRLQKAITSGATPRQRLVSLASLHLDFMRDNADTLQLMLRACTPATGDSAPTVDFERFRALYLDAMRTVVSSESSTRGFSSADVELLASVFHGAMGALRHDAMCNADRPDDLPEKIVDLLWGGFAARIEPR